MEYISAKNIENGSISLFHVITHVIKGKQGHSVSI